jgi:hypothetical protein
MGLSLGSSASAERCARFGSDMRLKEGNTCVIRIETGSRSHGGTRNIMVELATSWCIIRCHHRSSVMFAKRIGTFAGRASVPPFRPPNGRIGPAASGRLR